MRLKQSQVLQNLHHKFKITILKFANLSTLFRWREENVESSHFHTNKDIDKLIADTESTVTSDLEGGDRYSKLIYIDIRLNKLFLKIRIFLFEEEGN